MSIIQHLPESEMDNARTLEAHLLDAHRLSLHGRPSLAELRTEHADLHAMRATDSEGRTLRPLYIHRHEGMAP